MLLTLCSKPYSHAVSREIFFPWPIICPGEISVIRK